VRHLHDGRVRPGPATCRAEDLDAAIRELQWVEFTSATNRMQRPGLDQSISSQSELGSLSGAYCWRAGKTVGERELKPGRLVIGRTPDNDLQIDSKFISRHHCQIVTQARLLPDRRSQQHQRHIRAVQTRALHNLNDGDVVQVGQHEIMYIDERADPVSSCDTKFQN
jgi:general secretion pathway protein A